MPIRRRNPPTAEFVQEFQANVVPSAIPSAEFIDWDNMNAQIEQYNSQIEAVTKLRNVSTRTFVEGLADSLMAAEDTRAWIDFYFELLGERGNKYSAFEGMWKFYDVQRAIDRGEREAAVEIVDVLVDIGLQDIIDTADVRDHYRGMLVGMESHARKNRQGACFEALVEERVAAIIERLQQVGYTVSYTDEYGTRYDDESGQQKVVDFAIFEDDVLRLVVEANAYKVGGSKPSEIRRSYNHVAQRMNADDIAFVWITDGQGWAKSLSNVLAEAYDDLTDIYNLSQATHELPGDVVRFFETREL